MITWPDVVAVAPELADVPVVTQTAILEAVSLQLKASRWGDLYDLGCKYLAAHLAVVSKQGSSGPTGQVIAESVGSISRQYASNSPMGTDPIYDKTPYGREYRRLVRLLPSRVGFVC